MEIKATRTEDVVLLEAAGMIDTRGAIHFEREISSHFGEGIRRFVIDLGRVELITSAGIRVLVMLAKRVASGGGLVLCGLNEHVTAVFEVSGLLQHFPSAPSAGEGVARLRQAAALAPAGAHRSRVSRAAMRLLGPDGTAGEVSEASMPGPRSRLTVEVAQLLLTRAEAPGPTTMDPGGSPAQ